MRFQERAEERLEYYRTTPPEQLLRDHIYGILLLPVALLAIWIRLIPRDNMDYLQALDSYYAARSAEAIVRVGELPPLDPGRYVPFMFPTYAENVMNLYIPAYLYSLIEPVYNTVLTSFGAEELTFAMYTQIIPAFFGALMVVIMYFIGKEIYNREAGLFAAFFLAASPAVLHRSSAGWFQKEAISGPFIFASIYFLLRAWKEKSWGWGILSGVSLAIAAATWGGTQFVFLLYPLVAFAVLFIDEDVERLVAAFTPTLLLGHFLAAFINPGRNMIPDSAFLAGMGVLTLLWFRYAVEQFDIVSEGALPYVTPGATVAGAVALFLSPLYSQTLAGMVNGLIRSVRRSGGSVIGGTVAENQPPSADQIIGQLGVSRSQSVDTIQMFYPFAELFSGWTFSILGTAAMLAMVGYMLLKKYGVLEEIEPGKAYFGFASALVGVSALLMFLLPGQSQGGVAFMFPLIIGLGGAMILFFFVEKEPIDIENRWFLVLPLMWSLAALYGATQQSRLLFITSQPVALLAGFGLAVALQQLRASTLWTEVAERSEAFDARLAFGVVAALLLIPVLVFNVAAAQSMADGIGGSPDRFWTESLEEVRDVTEPDAVLLSWWDYGYWFNSIGGRAANVDGGNSLVYSDATGGERLNLPIADFLTAEDYAEYMDFVEMLGADYMVLDATMIGKYSAVSQISYRDNTMVDSMQTARCVQNDGQCVMHEHQGTIYMAYGPVHFGPNAPAEILVPVEQNGQELSPTGAPLVRLQGQGQGRVLEVENFCTRNEGIVRMTDNGAEDIPGGQTDEQTGSIPGCIAWHPPVYVDGQMASSPYGQIVFVPDNVMESALVGLYLMDAHGMPEFQAVEEVSNGYVKVWEIDHDAAG